MPYFSVMIPVYNVENYIGVCLESVKKQTYTDYEVIIIIDGSKDKSSCIAELFKEKDERIKIVYQENKGLFVARREAIKYATGKYYLFLDADDYWAPCLLERVYEVISVQNCDIVMLRYQCVDEAGVWKYCQRKLMENESVVKKANEFLIEKLATTFEYNPLWLKVVKSENVDKQLKYEHCKEVAIGEDALQSLDIVSKCEKMVYISDPLYYYRINPKSMSRNLTTKYLTDYMKVRTETEEYVKRRWELEDSVYIQMQSYTLRGMVACLLDIAVSNSSKKEWEACYVKIMTSACFARIKMNKKRIDIKGKTYFCFLNINNYTIYKIMGNIKKIMKICYDNCMV